MTSSPVSTDESLLQRLFAEPERGWQEFHSKFSPVINCVIRRYRLGQEDSSEVFQEVCLRLVKNDYNILRKWQPERCPLKGYLVVVTQSACLSFIQSSFHRFSRLKIDNSTNESISEHFLDNLENSTPSPIERIINWEITHILRKYLKELVKAGQITNDDFLLIEFRLGGMPWKQIGHLLNISPGTARVRLFRLREDFRCLLRQQDLEI